MHHFGFLTSKCAFPASASAEQAALGMERWLEAATDAGNAGDALRRFAAEAADDPLGRRLLDSVFGNSPFLTTSIIKEPEFARRLLNDGPDDTFAGVIEELERCRGQSLDHDGLARRLRIAKRRMALTVAIADITGTWALPQVTRALSDFADDALGIAAAHVIREAAGRGAFALKQPDDPERESGLVMIGVGKLGGRELNYSSDVDLIVLYDLDRIDTDNPEGLQNHFVRLTRDLIRLIEERTADGYVFRTDFRLRPDPGVTPIALSVLAAETYYESLGQNWERAAMIKARPVAGDRDAGDAFLKQLTPFVWRKNLDFAAIQDIHSIKRQIHAHRGGGDIAVGGHNIKLGRGGIREIEFFAQTLQLIWGGREPDLRAPATCEALSVLARLGRCQRNSADNLIEAYEFLRRLEHRLQMINDEQTQALPERPAELRRIAVFMGFDGTEAFADELLRHLGNVQKHYGELFEKAPTLAADAGGGDVGNLVFTGGDPDPETLSTIKALGYTNPEVVDGAVRRWHHGRYQATRSTRAREILTELMPALLKAIGATPAPDVAFLRFDEFLAGLPAGVQLFSMFHSNPQLLDLVAEIMGKAPRLAHHLSRRPATLDGVLTPDFFDPLPDSQALLQELTDLLARAEHIEQTLDLSRRWNNDRRFQVGVQCLRGAIQPGDAGHAFSAIAETALSGLFPVIEEEFAGRHGRFPGSGLAVLALGKLGSREMTATSDLDLIFIYRVPEGAAGETSDGEKPLDAAQYFARLSQRLINALTALTSEGLLYEVDMRLRPSGNRGPIASTLDGFVHYHAASAWTWERMALTRARTILGPPELCRLITEAVLETLMAARDDEALLRDVADMRRRLDAEHPAACLWALKHLRGGIVDIEFIAQYLTLKHAHEHPDILGHDTSGTLEALIGAELLDAGAGGHLIEALGLWQGLQGLLALTIEGEMTPERETEMSNALKEDLVRIGGAADFEALEAKISETADEVYRIFRDLIEDPAAVPGGAGGAAG